MLCVRCCTGAVCDWRVAVRAVLMLSGITLKNRVAAIDAPGLFCSKSVDMYSNSLRFYTESTVLDLVELRSTTSPKPKMASFPLVRRHCTGTVLNRSIRYCTCTVRVVSVSSCRTYYSTTIPVLNHYSTGTVLNRSIRYCTCTVPYCIRIFVPYLLEYCTSTVVLSCTFSILMH